MATSPLVLLKDGTGDTPFFITHGLGGNISEVCNIAEKTRANSPIYGLQWRGLDGAEAPDTTFEDMAEYFLKAITERQAHGPYLLAGLSIGGLAMLEVAQRLTARGEKVALLTFLDTYPHSRYWPLTSWIGVLSQRAVYHTSSMMDLPFTQIIHRLLKLSGGLGGHLRSRRGTLPAWVANEYAADPSDIHRLRRDSLEAYVRYQPRYYPGRIVFLRALNMTTFPRDPTKIWGDLTSELEIYNMPCSHTALISTHAGIVGDKLTVCLEEALQVPSR